MKDLDVVDRLAAQWSSFKEKNDSHRSDMTRRIEMPEANGKTINPPGSLANKEALDAFALFLRSTGTVDASV